MIRYNTQSLRAAAEKTTRSMFALRGLAFGIVLLGAAGCTARVQSRGSVAYSTPAVYVQEPTVYVEEPVVEVQTVPVEIEAYPRHTYRGSDVFLVEGQWYWRSRGRWVAYRTEPRALASVRVSYEAKYGRHYRPGNAAASPAPHKGHHLHH